MNRNSTFSKITAGVLSCLVQGVQWELHPYGSMYWKEENSLFVSDTHFGKVSHFRKHGIAVPTGAIQQNWDRLASLIDHYNPKEVVFLGDLFHSSYNYEWETFRAIGDTFHNVKLTLVEGNHDILDAADYKKAEIECIELLKRGPFLFSHHPMESQSLYNIHGHIHPAVHLRGKGRQSMKLPCFYFGKDYGIMPAFGNFTGTAVIPVKDGDQVCGMVGDSVIML